jgi:hypothetical protein
VNHSFFIGFFSGFFVGAVFAVALSAMAECCAQFDVPFNLQLEQERQETWSKALDTDYLDVWKERPCAR